MEKMHHSVTALVQQFEEDLPTFLYGNSMGCLIINSFLLKNPNLPIQGIIFGSPFFQPHKSAGLTPFRKWLLVSAAQGLEGFATQAPINLHKVGQTKSYMRKAVT